MSQPPTVALVPLQRSHAEVLAEMAREFRAEGDHRLDAVLDDREAFFREVERFADGRDLPAERVPQTYFLLFRGGRLLGGARLRHRLIPVLHLDGGNIGYEIRPAERGRGYGHAILAGTLEQARGRGMARVLLTAAADNLASLRVIERSGGVLDGTTTSPRTGETMRRYWIELGDRRTPV